MVLEKLSYQSVNIGAVSVLLKNVRFSKTPETVGSLERINQLLPLFSLFNQELQQPFFNLELHLLV